MNPPDQPSASIPFVYGAVVLSLLGLACFYFASSTSSLRMIECPSFPWTVVDPACRRTVYWSRAGLGGLAAGALLALGAYSRRAR